MADYFRSRPADGLGAAGGENEDGLRPFLLRRMPGRDEGAEAFSCAGAGTSKTALSPESETLRARDARTPA